MERGDIYWAELIPRSGSEQKGKRPVIIMSHDGFNKTPGWKSIIVIPVTTSSRQMGRGPTAIFLTKGTGKLSKDSIAICHQITTLDRSKLTQYIGTLDKNTLKKVEQGLKNAVDIS